MVRRTSYTLLRDNMSDVRRRFMQILALEKERNQVLKELEASLGFDISFSDESVLENATAVFAKQYQKELAEMVVKKWMK